MTKINPTFSMGYACIAILCLSACATNAPSKPVTLIRPGSTLPNGSVVLLDPTSDDSMLPALGEGLSRGAVTIYNLDGPQAPLPVRSAAPAQTATANYTGNGGMDTTASNVQLREPSSIGQDDGDGSNDSARVTIFGLDTGAPIAKRPVPVLAPSPNLPPPVDVSQGYQSPFTTNREGAVVLDNKPAVDKKSSKPKSKGKGATKTSAPSPIALPPGTTTLGAGSRAVTATDLMGSDMPAMPPPLTPYPTDTAPAARPPKGMTY